MQQSMAAVLRDAARVLGLIEARHDEGIGLTGSDLPGDPYQCSMKGFDPVVLPYLGRESGSDAQRVGGSSVAATIASTAKTPKARKPIIGSSTDLASSAAGRQGVLGNALEQPGQWAPDNTLRLQSARAVRFDVLGTDHPADRSFQVGHDRHLRLKDWTMYLFEGHVRLLATATSSREDDSLTN
jgi:hypothetical protein